MDKRKVIYYEDELNDEFSTAKINAIPIDSSYVYDYPGFFKKFTHFFWYRIVATPIAFLYVKLALHHSTTNRSVLKPYRRTGIFIYGNHTQPIGDAFIPSMLTFPQNVYLIVHPNNVSMPLLGKITPSLGALPLPDGIKAFHNFLKAIGKRIAGKRAVVIYPEAHIWPFYTKIRPFKDTSFRYPVKYDAPIFCFTNTYKKRRFSKKPRIVTYIDGPFFADKSLSLKERQRDLRDKVYSAMQNRAKCSVVEMIKYIKKGEENG